MTCIVGLEKGKTVWLGGDSAATSGDLGQLIIADKKVFARGEFIFGICGTPKILDVLNHEMTLPDQGDEPNDRKFIGSTFITAIKEAFKKSGCVIEHHGEQVFEGAVLIGYRGRLYRMEANFQLITSAHRFDAVGSGQDIALGALHDSSRKLFNNPRKRILSAREAAAINNAAVRPPFAIVSVKAGDSVE